MIKETLIFGQEESVDNLLKVERCFVREGDKTTFYLDSMDRYNHVGYYAEAIGCVLARYNVTFTNADGFEKLKDFDLYNRISLVEFPLMDEYNSMIGWTNNPLKNALKNMPQEQLNDLNLLTSNTSKNPLIEPLQQMGIEIIKNKKDTELLVVLDGLDMDKAASKAVDENAHLYSALHHIYNDRDSLKDKTIFFKGNKIVRAPWIQNAKLWEQSKKTLETQKDNLNRPASFLETLRNLKKKVVSQEINAKNQVPKQEKSTELSHSR